MPRLTGRVFSDLAIWMVSLGLATGIAFPFLTIPLGVSAGTALMPSFFAACCTAGLFVGALNFMLVRGVVGKRLRRLAGEMTKAAEGLREAEALGTSLGAGAEQWHIPVDSDDELGESAAAFNHLAEALTDSHRALTTRATTDALTGLPNRAAFDERLTAEVARARRYGRPLAFAILDIDYFKQINDRHGHDVGDQMLIQIAHRLARITRAGEFMARLGGEEFGWLLPETGGPQAADAADRLRGSLALELFPTVGRVTLSVGICDLGQVGNASDLYRFADRALYSAKEQGRNACVLYGAGSIAGVAAPRAS